MRQRKYFNYYYCPALLYRRRAAVIDSGILKKKWKTDSICVIFVSERD